MKYATKFLIWFSAFPPSSGTVRQCHLGGFQPSPYIGINIITLPVNKGGRWYVWLTSEEAGCKNDSIRYFKYSVDISILYAEGNSCGIISIPSIEITFDHYHIHVLRYLPNRYIYVYLISNLIRSEATIWNRILQFF